MTTINEARESVYQRFIDQWAGRTPVTLDNESYQPPAGAWVRLAVRHFTSGQESMGPTGSRRFGRGGAVLVQVFTPADEGLRLADTLSGAVREIFEGVGFDGLRFRGVLVREIGPDGRWFQTNIEAPFEYDAVK